MNQQTVQRNGKRYVLVEPAELRRLEKLAAKAQEGELPAWPPANAEGNRPAAAFARVSIARKIIEQRRALGISQQELARLAGVRQETISRLESGKHSPTIRTVDKIDEVLRQGLRQQTAINGKGGEAHEFERDELVRILRYNGQRMVDQFFQPDSDLEALIKGSVARNTFRGFHHVSPPPSVIFREWARSRLTTDLFRSLARNQSNYDKQTDKLAKDLAKYWLSKSGKPLTLGPGRKLLDLLLKNAVRWSKVSPSTRHRLVQLLHVPLDKFSLVAIRRIAASGEFGPTIKIPAKPSMGFITSCDQYRDLQEIMRRIAARANVPPICIDLVG